MKEVLEKFIRKFKMLTNEEVQLIMDSTIVKSFKKGTELLREGQMPTECYLILDGCIREYIIKEGEEKTTAFYLEGDTVNHAYGSSKKPPSRHFLECVEDCIVTVSNEDFENEMRKKIPRLDAIIQQEATEASVKAKDEITTFIASTPEERYLNLLENRPELFNRVPQHQIASYLGITPESLSRIRSRTRAAQRNYTLNNDVKLN